MLADHLPSGDGALALLAALSLILTITLLPRTFPFLTRLASPSPVAPPPTKPKPFYGPRPTTTTSTPPTPLDLTSTPPCPDPSPETAAPDRWYRDPYISSRVYTATMALRAVPAADWLRVDANYAARMAHKRGVLAAHGWPQALDCRPAAEPAVRELLAALVAYLPRRFPSVWAAEGDGDRWLRNGVTGERWEVREPWGGLRPLEVVARITEEDLAVLVPPEGEKEGEDGEYVLKAVVSAFPAGFDIEEKMDRGLTAIHGPVPTYKEKLQRAMNKFFKSMTADRLVMRVNWGINDREELFFLDGTHLYEGDEASADDSIDINQVQLRVERQVLRRLPVSGAMCMMTKTYLYRLVDIAQEPGFAERLGGLLHKLPEKFAFYKRKPVWGKVVLAYLDEMAAKYPAIPTEDE
ncbi:hypothetical protein SLS56_003666 [Neofusicoccum ribis]|uniref:Uncharacterized protein n=1 Tax=Neofusicoccum ribis TaxID=45134 RepID=A0ABR3SYK2_9PEZI